jgi:DHA2 family multidrug resistance protein
VAQVNRLADQQAFTMAATDLFWLSAALFLMLIPLVWLTRRPGGGGGDAAAGAH